MNQYDDYSVLDEKTYDKISSKYTGYDNTDQFLAEIITNIYNAINSLNLLRLKTFDKNYIKSELINFQKQFDCAYPNIPPKQTSQTDNIFTWINYFFNIFLIASKIKKNTNNPNKILFCNNIQEKLVVFLNNLFFRLEKYFIKFFKYI